MSFNNEYTKTTGDYLANSSTGMGLNITPSVGRFKEGDQVPSISMEGNVHCPAHNTLHSMAPQSNYGKLNKQQISQHIEQTRPTHSESSGSNLGPERKMNSLTPKKNM